MKKLEEKDVTYAIKKYLQNLSDVEEVIDEYKLKNGLIADLVTKKNKKINHIVECKGTVDIGEITKGLGQAYQYSSEPQSNKNFKKPNILFACPESSKEQIDRLKITKEIKQILLVDDKLNVKFYSKTKKNIEKKEIYLHGTTFLESFEIERTKKILKKLYEISDVKDKKQNFEKHNFGPISDNRNLLIALNSTDLVKNHTLTTKGYELFLSSIEKNDINFKRKIWELLQNNLLVVLDGIFNFIKDKNNSQCLNNFKITSKQLEQQIQKKYNCERIKHFDHRRLGYHINLLIWLGFLEKKLKNHYEWQKISLNWD